MMIDRLRAAIDIAGRDHLLLAGDDLPGSIARELHLPAPAAVLVAITDRVEPGLILTRRADTLSRHPGQIAFPGGRIDPGETAVEAALREAHEEISLPTDQVDLIGPVDRYRTITGFDVTPVVAIIPPDLDLAPSAAEVAAIFEVPLAFVLDRANQIGEERAWKGSQRHYYVIDWQGYRIWGATAAIIVNLSRRLAWTA